MYSSALASILCLAAAAKASSSSAHFFSNNVTVMDDGVIRENNVTHRALILQKLYPDQSFQMSEYDETDLESRADGQTHFSYTSGGVYIAGYYAFLGGAGQVKSTINDCKGIDGIADGLSCAVSASEFVVAHGLAAFIGGTYGEGHVAFIAEYARSITGLNPANHQNIGARDSCPVPTPFNSHSTWPSNTQGVKISAENTCLNMNQNELNQCTIMAKHLIPDMMDNNAVTVQATYWEGTQPNNILARMTFSILSETPTSCPDVITGSGCHFDS